jgi:hypothetical protein
MRLEGRPLTTLLRDRDPFGSLEVIDVDGVVVFVVDTSLFSDNEVVVVGTAAAAAAAAASTLSKVCTIPSAIAPAAVATTVSRPFCVEVDDGIDGGGAAEVLLLELPRVDNEAKNCTNNGENVGKEPRTVVGGNGTVKLSILRMTNSATNLGGITRKRSV